MYGKPTKTGWWWVDGTEDEGSTTLQNTGNNTLPIIELHIPQHYNLLQQPCENLKSYWNYHFKAVDKSQMRRHCRTASRPSKQILHTGTNKKFPSGEDKESWKWHTTKYQTQNPSRHCLTFCRTDTSLASARKQITYVRPVASSLCYATGSPHDTQCSYNRMKTFHKTNKYIN